MKDTAEETMQPKRELCAENLFRKGLIPAICREYSDEELVQDLHHVGYTNGLYLGYLYAIKDLIDSGVSFKAVLPLIKRIPERTIQHDPFDQCEKRTNELVREIDAYVDANTIYASK